MQYAAAQTSRLQQPRFRCGLTCSLAIGFLTIGLCWIVLRADIPLWFQPTAVGAAWGMLFAVGLYLGTVGQYRFAPAAISLAVVCISKYALQALTDLNGAECCLLVCVLTLAGWLASRPRHLFTNVGSHGVAERGSDYAAPSKMLTWSIWDLGLLTTLVAIFCSSVSNISSSPAIVSQVAIALCGGLVASWSACVWASCDQWSLWRLSLIGLVLITMIGLVAAQSPGPMNPLQIAMWVIVGPLAVASAQSVTVLAIIALARIDAKLASHTPTLSAASVHIASQAGRVGVKNDNLVDSIAARHIQHIGLWSPD